MGAILMNINIRHCKFQQRGYYNFSAVTFSNYITLTLGNPKLEILQLFGMELMFNEYILGQYLTLISQIAQRKILM